MPVFDFLGSSKLNERKSESEKKLEEISVDQIFPNPNQPRQSFDDEGISELAQSIRQVGLIQPLVVRRMEGGYELVAGERRLRACKSIGMQKVTCIIQNDVYEEDSAMMALIENLQRENLHYLEEARCYAALLNNYSLKQEDLAVRLGKSQSSIANKLRILKLSPEVKAAMTEARLTERHARALLRIRDEQTQLDIINKIGEKGLSVKETEKLVDKTLNKLYDQRAEGARPRPKIIRLVKDYRLFMNSINTAINQLRETGMRVEVEQTDREDGVDIAIHVTKA
ncbi:MAG: Nucleoid occlusion protein [Firmicutes bacterium ADurb.Bin182]|nr:MAG: Nucleoid occlusion protein [Firmicutes bacterium ADurb.Bin182]